MQNFTSLDTSLFREIVKKHVSRENNAPPRLLQFMASIYKKEQLPSLQIRKAPRAHKATSRRLNKTRWKRLKQKRKVERGGVWGCFLRGGLPHFAYTAPLPFHIPSCGTLQSLTFPSSLCSTYSCAFSASSSSPKFAPSFSSFSLRRTHYSPPTSKSVSVPRAV